MVWAGTPRKVKRVMKDTVLLINEGEPYCSGFVAKDRKGVSRVWTAGHCCAPAFIQRTFVRYIYKGSEYASSHIMSSDMDPNGTDICRVPGTANRHRTRLEIVDQEWVEDPNDGVILDRDLWAVQPYWKQVVITIKGNDIVLRGNELKYSKLWRIDPGDRNFRMTWVSGVILPGMSGSPVVDGKGGVVGVVSKWFGDAIFPVGGVAMFNTSSLD